jgi:hypothetical protein
MNRLSTVLALLAAISVAAFGQSPANPATTASTFTLSASVLSLPTNNETAVATDIGATFAVTKNFLLRSDTILSPAVNLTGYFGGIQYALPSAKILAKTNFDPASFQFYLTASGGESRITVGSAPVLNHFAALAGGGINYDPTGKGKFSVNLVEVRYAHIPGLSQNTVIVASGLKLGF